MSTAIIDPPATATATPATTPVTPAPAAEPLTLPSGTVLSAAAVAALGPEPATDKPNGTPAATAPTADANKPGEPLRDEGGRFKSPDPSKADAKSDEPKPLPAALVSRGEKLGLTQYEIEQLGGEKEIAEYLDFYEQELSAGDDPPDPDAGKQTPPATPPKKTEQAADTFNFEDEPPPLDPAVEDEATIKRDAWYRKQLREARQQATALQKTLDERLGPLEEFQRQGTKAAAQREADRKSDLIDREVEKLGPEFVGIFGKGDRTKISAPYFRARGQLYRLMEKLGEDFPNDDEPKLFERAVKAAYGEVFDRVQTRRRHEEVRKQSGKRSGGGNDAGDAPPPQPNADGPLHADPVIQSFLASRERR